ncbi:MAG: phage major capsid protein [Oscillospiraceae bacterium]|jgi:HK97 family phage major capsid protein|nr:phage major capsid protein [Oscillospiraceae bacterium]
MNRFWNFVQENNARVLYLQGAIADETWFGDEVTPAAFKSDLASGAGDITVIINSPGGDVFAAAEIYNALKDYPGKVTVKIDGMAASAASIIAMAGDEVLISPVSYMVIHNPSAIAIGDSEEMLKAKATLDEIKEGIINAYELKTGLARDEISRLMDLESCFNAKKAVDLGFADGILYTEHQSQNEQTPVLFSRATVTNSLLQTINGGNIMSDKPILSTPGAYNPGTTDTYAQAFWQALRGRGITNVLAEGTDSAGGFLVPDEFSSELVVALQEQNIFRRIARIVKTSREKLKVPVATVTGTAAWLDENEAVPESDSAFGQIVLNAYKLGTLMKASTELIEDAAFNIEAFIAAEFARRIAIKEEEAFCIGDGDSKPTGIFSAIGGAQVGATAASATTLSFDDTIELFYSLKPAYRSKASFVTNDSTLKLLRKVKDGNGQYIWQPAVKDGAPDTILGRPVLTSPFVPAIAAGASVMAFGDFSYYWIADRRDTRFKVLNELYAQNDQVGFFATERVDGKLVLPEAIKLLNMATN